MIMSAYVGVNGKEKFADCHAVVAMVNSMGAEHLPELTQSAGSAVLLEVTAVSYTYPHGHREVLHDVTLDVREGEFVSLVGPSGCGKSTLVSAVAGLLPGYQGSIRFRGQPIDRPHPKIGVVFQED